MAIEKNEVSSKIWKYLIENGINEIGTAALMGNIYAESAMIPNRVQNLCLKRLKENGYGTYTNESYTAAIDNGTLTKDDFLHPIPKKQYGYGLCQWTSPGRKSGLYDLAKSKGVSIGDIDIQLSFLLKQLSSNYKSVFNTIKNATSIEIASNKILKDFEAPSNWSQYSTLRINYSNQYYNIFIKQKEKEEKNITSNNNLNWNIYYNKISNSGSDERGKYSGGQAGDQTGKEWRIIDWYNRPWDRVLRYPDQNVRELIALISIEAAQNNLIGYDQNQRDTYWQHLKASNYRPSQITIACESDCSAGVIANVKAVGYLLNISKLKTIDASYTGNMESGFKKAGFEILTDNKYLTSSDYLMPGDILLLRNHHTATNLGIGKKITYNSITNNTNNTNNTNDKNINFNPIAKGIVTANALYVRTWAGTEFSTLKSIPIIYKNTIIEICDTIKDKKGKDWYFIRINNKTYGFSSATYIKKI